MTGQPLVEPHSGIRFPARLTPPGAAAAQSLAGAGIQQFSLFRINVYAFGLYVDRAAARATLADYAGRPASRLAEDDGFYRRLLELRFAASLRLVLAREVAGADVGRAFDEALRPRLDRWRDAAGTRAEGAPLRRLRGYFALDRLRKGTEILLCYHPPERLAVVVERTEHEPIRSRPLCEVLFDMYLGTAPVSAQGRRSVIARFPSLLAGPGA